MPRKYKRVEQNDRPVHSNEHMLQAVKMVLKEEKSIREVAKATNISKSVLARNVSKFKSNDHQDNVHFRPDLQSRMVFSLNEEMMLKEYILTASYMNYGLTKKQVLSLAYEYGNALKHKLPAAWVKNCSAGSDWYYGFMDRHPTLSLRTPESTSIGRSTSFNKANVDAFLTNLKSLYERYNFPPDRVYNCDETGVTTVHKPPKVIAAKGKKQVGQATSGERGELVTVLFIINAIGNTIPPVFVFPRVKFKDYFLNGAPVGSLGLSCRSGWMTADLFPHALEHIIQTTKCTKEHPLLLILDNHGSHITIETINKARDNGVIMLTFPPHTSHKLQPLDVSVFSSFKSRYNLACHDYLINNPGKIITIYNIAELVGKVYQSSITPVNIISGFKATGIYPFNSEPFTEEDYLTSSVTDRHMPADVSASTLAADILPYTPSTSEASMLKTADILPCTPSTSEASMLSTADILPCTPSTSEVPMLSPSDIRPFPKAGPRKLSKKGRRRGRTKILTDTPEKEEIERQATQKRKKLKIKKRKLIVDDSTDEETVMSLHDDSEDDIEEKQDPEEIRELNWDINPLENIGLNDFVLVRFLTKKSKVSYVGRVEGKEETGEFNILFMRKNEKGNFFFPQEVDSSLTEREDIITKLPPPMMVGGTSRAQCYFSFDVDFSHYNVR